MRLGDNVTTAMGLGKVIEVDDDHVVIEIVEGEHQGKVHRIQFPKVLAIKKPRAVRVLSNPTVLQVDAGLLGFIASCCTLMVEAPLECKDSFMHEYDVATGGAPWDDTRFFPTANKWGVECRIILRAAPVDIQSFDMVRFVVRQRGDTMVINHNDLWWKLVGLGFRLGSVQNVETIMSHLPVSQHDCFLQGCIMDKTA